MKGSLFLCGFTQVELSAVLCQQPSVPSILHAIFHIQPLQKTRACTIFYSSGIVWKGGGGFERVGARREWCRWQLWLLSSARYAAACLWYRCLLYSGETTVPRGAFERNHTSLTPQIPWCSEHSFLHSLQGNLNGRQVGIMANNGV